MTKRQLTFAVALAAGTLLAAAAQAGIIEYNDRTTWLAAISGATGGENFNGFASDTSFDGTSVGLAAGMTIGSLTAAGVGNIIDAPPVGASEHNVDGTSVAFVFNGQSGTGAFPFIAFSDPISAFGADFKNLNDDFARTAVQLFDGMTLLTTLDPVPTAVGVVRFWGFAADAGETITEIRFLRNDNDVFGIDDIEIRAAAVAAVPEPATLALFGFGIAGLGFARRRKQS